jgi:hypothetical protein
MINNLTNNMITSLTSIHNKNKIIDENIFQVDINTIVINAKSDKRFHKLLSLCIKYDIHLFNQCNEICTLLSIENLLQQSDQKQCDLTKELSKKILDISNNKSSNTWLIDIDNIYVQYKKKFKEIEIIVYVLKNMYNDDLLEQLCCIKNKKISTTSNSQNNASSSNTKYDTNQINNSNSNSNLNTKLIKKKEKQSKFIAIYSNQ